MDLLMITQIKKLIKKRGAECRLKQLEKLFQKLYGEKITYLNKIEEFNRVYYLELGDILEKIVTLKKEILYYEN